MKTMLERQEENNSDVFHFTSGKFGCILTKDDIISVEEGGDLIDSVPKVPSDWHEKHPSKIDGEINFEDLDNSGSWNDYIFRPVYKNE